MKLLVVSISLFIASMMHAASIKWGVMGNTTPITTPNGSIAYFIESSASRESILSSIANESFDFGTALGSGVVTDGNVYDIGTDDNYYVASADLPAGTDYSFYVVIFNATSADEATQFILSSEYVASIYEGDNPQTIIDFGPNVEGEGWTSIVPEPTALALLALGVAGLALRRRVA